MLLLAEYYWTHIASLKRKPGPDALLAFPCCNAKPIAESATTTPYHCVPLASVATIPDATPARGAWRLLVIHAAAAIRWRHGRKAAGLTSIVLKTSSLA